MDEKSSPTTTASARWQATLEAEKAAILDFVVDGKIGDDPSPTAVEHEALRRIAEKAPDTRLTYTAKELDDFITACGTRPPPAVEIEALKLSKNAGDEVICGQATRIDELHAKLKTERAALLARLREPEMREAVAHALHRSISGPQAVWDGLRLGEMDWFRSHADAALAVITEKLT